MSSPQQHGSNAGAASNEQGIDQPNAPFLDWVAKTQKALETDQRARPWKETFGDSVDKGFDGKDDWALVRTQDDVQHNA